MSVKESKREYIEVDKTFEVEITATIKVKAKSRDIICGECIYNKRSCDSPYECRDEYRADGKDVMFVKFEEVIK